MIFVFEFLFLIITYFVCAIPFGLILTKTFLNQDVRMSGSGNIGATNVTRIGGKKLGALTLLLDGLKGAAMVIFARFSFVESPQLHLYLVLVSLVAVLAHIYPIYLNYKGGKGVATAIAVLLALDPIVGFLTIIFWVMTFSLSRISSISSLISIFSSIILSFHYEAPSSQIVLCLLLSIIITYRHKENIMRLLLGEENKIQ